MNRSIGDRQNKLIADKGIEFLRHDVIVYCGVYKNAVIIENDDYVT